MPDILREVTEHALKIKLGSKSVKQRLHRFDEEKHRALVKRLRSFWRLGSSMKYTTPSG